MGFYQSIGIEEVGRSLPYQPWDKPIERFFGTVCSKFSTLASLTKQRTILNVHKKKRKKLYDALADVEALTPAAQLYEDGLFGMEYEFARYTDAVDTLKRCPIPRERLTAEKADVYRQLAELNRQIRVERKKLALCREIQENLPGWSGRSIKLTEGDDSR